MPAKQDPRYKCDTMNAKPSNCPTNSEVCNAVTLVKNLYTYHFLASEVLPVEWLLLMGLVLYQFLFPDIQH